MIERRKQNLDPIDVYSVETWALLKLCGAVRKSDLSEPPPEAAPASPIPERRREERRQPGAETVERPRD